MKVPCIIILLISSALFVHPALAEELKKEDKKPALGLSARPGTYLFTNIPIGKRHELSQPLRIENRSNKVRTYILYTYKYSEKSGIKRIDGYSDMPDVKWLLFEKDEVEIEANGVSEVKMYSNISDDDAYYNQHWVIGIGIEGRQQKGEAIALAVYPRYFIETESRGDLAGKPYGIIGIRPSTITLKDMPLNKTEKVARIEVFNNDRIQHRYQITSVIPTNDPGKGILLSHSYNGIPDPNWVIPQERWIDIAGGSSGTIAFGLDIPQEVRNCGKTWEGLLMIRPDQRDAGFVRIQISTQKWPSRSMGSNL